MLFCWKAEVGTSCCYDRTDRYRVIVAVEDTALHLSSTSEERVLVVEGAALICRVLDWCVIFGFVRDRSWLAIR